MEKEFKKAVLYARVSSREQEQEGFSIPAQVNLLKEYAERKNITIVKEFKEAETAKISGRTEFNNMIAFLKEYSDIKDVLVEKTDRMYRNFKDYLVIDDLNLNIHFVKEGGIFNKDSKSHDKLIHEIKLVIAKNYIDNLSEEVKKGQRVKAEQGGYPHGAPVGYQNTVMIEGKRKEHVLIPEPEGAKLVKTLFELYATGRYSLNSLRKKVIEEGLTGRYKDGKVSKTTIARILQSPIYYGMVPYKDKLYPGNHEPLISKELFNTVQDILTGKGLRKGKSREPFLFSGQMDCNICGCAITAEIKKGKYIYYHCTNYKGICSKKGIREEKLEEMFAPILKGVKLDKEKIEWIKEGLRESRQEEKEYHDKQIEVLQREFNNLKDRLHEVYLDKIDGKITQEFWKENHDRWSKRQEEVVESIELHRKANKNYLEIGNELLDYAFNAYEEYKLQKDKHQRRKVIKIVLSNSKLCGQNLVPNYNEPFAMFAKCVKTGNTRTGRDSNPRIPCGISSFQDYLLKPLGHLSFFFFYCSRQSIPLFIYFLFALFYSSKEKFWYKELTIQNI